MGPCAEVDYNSPYLIENSVFSYPPPITKGMGKISPIGWAHLYQSANFQNCFFYVNSKNKYREGVGNTDVWEGFESWPYFFE